MYYTVIYFKCLYLLICFLRKVEYWMLEIIYICEKCITYADLTAVQ